VTVRGGASASVGPYERQGEVYEVRLERVPGGLRLAEWSSGQLRPVAPVLAARDVSTLVADAARSGVVDAGGQESLVHVVTEPPSAPQAEGEGGPQPERGAGVHGASPGRSGELRDELRVERLDHERVRIARWLFRPGTGWDLLDAPPMLPARRYADALADAARRHLLSG
jgi:hypothetical protein